MEAEDQRLEQGDKGATTEKVSINRRQQVFDDGARQGNRYKGNLSFERFSDHEGCGQLLKTKS